MRRWIDPDRCNARIRTRERTNRSFGEKKFFFSPRAISTGADDVYPIMHTSPTWPERDRRPAPKNSSCSPIHKQSRDVIAFPLVHDSTRESSNEDRSIHPAIPPIRRCVRACSEQTPFNWYIAARSENAISRLHPMAHRRKYTNTWHRVYFINSGTRARNPLSLTLLSRVMRRKEKEQKWRRV